MITYRQLLANLESMPESELDTCIRVEDFDYGAERKTTRYIEQMAYNTDMEFVLQTDDLAANLP